MIFFFVEGVEAPYFSTYIIRLRTSSKVSIEHSEVESHSNPPSLSPSHFSPAFKRAKRTLPFRFRIIRTLPIWAAIIR